MSEFPEVLEKLVRRNFWACDKVASLAGIWSVRDGAKAASNRGIVVPADADDTVLSCCWRFCWGSVPTLDGGATMAPAAFLCHARRLWPADRASRRESRQGGSVFLHGASGKRREALGERYLEMLLEGFDGAVRTGKCFFEVGDGLGGRAGTRALGRKADSMEQGSYSALSPEKVRP